MKLCCRAQVRHRSGRAAVLRTGTDQGVRRGLQPFQKWGCSEQDAGVHRGKQVACGSRQLDSKERSQVGAEGVRNQAQCKDRKAGRSNGERGRCPRHRG